MVECPECETLFGVGRRQKIGDIIECPECNAQLEVIGLDPLEVDLVLEEGEWDRAGDEDDEDELFDAWECAVCGYIHNGRRPPSHCPECGAGGDQFDYLEDDLFDEEEYDYDFEDEFAG